MRLTCVIVAVVAGYALAPGLRAEQADASAGKRVPLIYGTDLLHPHDDPDDHFDPVSYTHLRAHET